MRQNLHTRKNESAFFKSLTDVHFINARVQHLMRA